MDVAIDRRIEVPDAKDLKFMILIRSLDNHTHGELTRADKDQMRAALARAADEIQAMLSPKAAANDGRRCNKQAPSDGTYFCDRPLGHAGYCGQERPGRKGVIW